MEQQDMLEQMAPMFGLVKVPAGDGSWYWGYKDQRPDASHEEADFGWYEPTQAQVDAIHFVCNALGTRVPPNDQDFSWQLQVMLGANEKAMAVDADQSYKLNVFDFAEVVLMFPQSLGYQQLKGWIKEPPSNCSPDFPMSAALLKGIVDSGYVDGKWYPELETLKPMQLMMLISFNDMLAQLKQHTLLIIAATIPTIISLIVNTRKKQLAKAPVKGTRKCIHPECENMVDMEKKKSGACCKAHMNFECTHPKCVERARVNDWSRPTHPFGTKIAAAHWEYRKK